MRQWIAMISVMLLCSVGQLQAATVLVVGDSISAAFGLETQQQGWVALLQERLQERSADFKVVNAAISGDTTGGGLARLPQLLDTHQPDYLIVELGGNDGLRGLSLPQMRSNLTAMVQQAKQQDAEVLLLGMRLPSNYGRRYTEAFYNVFQQVAEQQQVALVDFFLEGVGGVEGMMQEDGVHPTQSAQPLLLENAWQGLLPLLPAVANQ